MNASDGPADLRLGDEGCPVLHSMAAFAGRSERDGCPSLLRAIFLKRVSERDKGSYATFVGRPYIDGLYRRVS